MSEPFNVIYPKRGSWIGLIIATSPIWGLGFYALAARFWMEAIGSLCFAAFIVGYNLTMRLDANSQNLELRRFGRKVWSVPTSAAKLRRGRVGDLNLQGGYKVESDGKQVGYLLDGWFAKDAIQYVLRLTNSI